MINKLKEEILPYTNPDWLNSRIDMVQSVTQGNGPVGFFGLEYNKDLDTWLTASGGVAGAFESGSAIGTAQSLRSITFSTAKTGLKVTKGLGTVGGILTLAVAGHEVLTGHDNTHTWVDVGMTGLGIGVVTVVGTAALPAVAVVGLGYGIWSAVGGSDWIDRNWGYREPK